MSLKWTFALPGGALTTFPRNLAQLFFLRSGSVRAPSAPPGYAYGGWRGCCQLAGINDSPSTREMKWKWIT